MRSNGINSIYSIAMSTWAHLSSRLLDLIRPCQQENGKDEGLQIELN